MIPVLYDEMENLYTSSATYWNADPAVVKANIPKHRIGYLADTLNCKVSEERNGEYELILTYPVTGRLYDEIIPGRAIMAKAHPDGDDQLFRIYRTSKVLRGIITVYARHISYDLSGIALNVGPWMSVAQHTATGWMTRLFQNTFFTAQSNIATVNDIKCQGLMSIRAALGGVEGSVLDVFRGEYTFDNYVVHLDTARGTDKGVIIEYGKNMTDMTMEQDIDAAYTHVRGVARYYDANSNEKYVDGTLIATGVALGYTWTKILDVTDMLGLDTDVVPTQTQVDNAVNAWIAANPLGVPAPTITVSYVDAQRPTNIPNVTIGLCDIVTVRYIRLGINVQQKVVATEYDTLNERYSKITLGQRAANLAGTVSDMEGEVASIIREKTTFKNGSKTVDLGDGIARVYEGTNRASLYPDRLVFHDGSEGPILGVYKLFHDSTSTAETTYTKTLPSGSYLLVHFRNGAPTTASTGLQVMVIGTSSYATVIPMDGSGSNIGAASGTRSHVAVTSNGDGTGTVTWTVQGLSYRKLLMLRLT